MRQRLFRISWALQRWLTPGLRYSQDAYEEVLGRHVAPGIRWLDVGCGHQVLSAWRGEAETTLVGRCGLLVGIDFDLPSLRAHRSIRHACRGEISRLPFADATFDLVTANMVVEHLDDPASQFEEIARVLRPGGVFLFHTPNERSYLIRVARMLPDGTKKLLARVLEGRREEDVFPTFYRANNQDRIRALADAAGFDVGGLDLVTTSPIFAMITPLLVPELLWIRRLMRPGQEDARTNIIAALVRRERAVAAPARALAAAVDEARSTTPRRPDARATRATRA